MVKLLPMALSVTTHAIILRQTVYVMQMMPSHCRDKVHINIDANESAYELHNYIARSQCKSNIRTGAENVLLNDSPEGVCRQATAQI